MADTLPPEQRASYSAIIDKILGDADLNTISAKRIRKGLQERVHYDIAPQKEAITALIMERFDKAQSVAAASQPPEPAPTTNGTAARMGYSSPQPAPISPAKRKVTQSTSEEPDGDEDEDLSELAMSPPPAKKVKKIKGGTEESDEAYAKRLAAVLNAPSARSTRGGGTTKRKSAVKKDKKTPKKKSKAKINSDDDSEVDASGGEKPEKERKGGFHKPMTLSEPLSALLGETALSRPQTVKQIWAYVKARDLQDPSDKRQIRCDDAMRAVFKQDRVHMFTMNKLLASHLYAQDE